MIDNRLFPALRNLSAASPLFNCNYRLSTTLPLTLYHFTTLPLFRDQFARCPWVHVSQDGEQCENGNHVFCLPYGLLAAVLLLADLMALPHPLLCLPHTELRLLPN